MVNARKIYIKWLRSGPFVKLRVHNSLPTLGRALVYNNVVII